MDDGAGTDVSTDEFVALQQVVAGRFSLDREIGRGGMGIVYLARDVSLDRPVAIKLLPLELAGDPAVRERFLREARTAAGLSHPNIVPIHAVEEHGDIVFFVMSFVDGETLRELVERKGPLTPHKGATVFREVAWALSLAHARGIIHRDIKPDNILIERATGRAMVTDFGIARPMDASRLTGVGEVVGTVHYMSPEQASGDDVDGRSDLYSLGVTAFFALTGQLLFDGPHAPAIIAQHLTEQPTPIGSVKDLPGPLAAAIDRCLCKKADDRHPDAASFADDVSSALATTPNAPPEVRLFLRWNTTYSTVSGIAFLGVLTGLALENDAVVAVGVVTILAVMAELAMRVRRLQQDGFTREDVVTAIRLGKRARQEELLVDFDRPLLTWLPKGRVRAVFAGLMAMGLGVGGVILALILWFSGDEDVRRWWWLVFSVVVGALGIAGFGGLSLLGGLFPARLERLGVWFRRRVAADIGKTTWNSWVGRLFFKLTRPRTSVPRVSAPHAPTERLVLDAADALVNALPGDVRERLGGVSDVIKRLERKAAALRARQAELDSALAEAGDLRGHGDAVSSPRRAEMIQRLQDARHEATQRLATIVAAMDNVRIGLIQLRAGVATVEEITEELGKAEELSQRIEAELEMLDALE